MTMQAFKPARQAPQTSGRMSAPIRKGRIVRPMRIMIHGSMKVGKTTFASGAPDPIFLSLDDGTDTLDVARLPTPETWLDVLEGVQRVIREDIGKTLVVDPFNYLEPLIYKHLCETNGWDSIESPGYGKGYVAALDQWRLFRVALEQVWTKGLNVILVGHSAVRPFRNPEGEDYERYQLAMRADAAQLFLGWVDAIFFARLEAFAKREKGAARAKGFSTGQHMLCTKLSALWDAGNRWDLPEEIPLDWGEFVAAKGAAETRLRAQIDELCAAIGDDALTAQVQKFVAESNGDVSKLAGAASRLTARWNEKQAAEAAKEST
jgi:hypothetical protein